MSDITNNDSYDDISEMIENSAGKATPPSPEELEEALRKMAESRDEEIDNDPWKKRCQSLQSYPLDVIRDGSDEYIKALTEAILAITGGDYGSIDYKGYKIYYNDTPHLSSISLNDGHAEYSYYVGFRCEALRGEYYEEYHSEEERKAYLDPENDLFENTLALLDKEIEELDEGKWIRNRKTLNIYDFKDYSPDPRKFKQIEWEDRNKDASDTFSFLIEDALMRAEGQTFTEDDFNIFADVIRRMVFFADYGKRNYLVNLQGLIWFEWKPRTKRDRYIWLCMDEFGQGDLPDRLLDNCTIYYFRDDPQSWEALAYLLPIAALWEMCHDYDPDNVKNVMLNAFSLIPEEGYRERIEKLIEEDRAKADEGESEDDQENI